MTRAAPAALLALVLAPALARADEPAGALASASASASAASAAPAEPKPDPAALEAGDANLESTALRQGIVVTLGIGGGLSIGLGMDNATGRGGAGTLRIAHVANRRTMVAIELVGSALFFTVKESTLYRTDAANVLLSAQYYVNPALWLRAGAGWGRYAGNRFVDEATMLELRKRIRLAGPAASVGAGIDIVRLKRFRAGLEVSSTAMINRDGILSSNSFLFAFSID
jgi:hypothetical protein